MLILKQKAYHITHLYATEQHLIRQQQVVAFGIVVDVVDPRFVSAV